MVHQPIAFSQLSGDLMKHSKDILNYGFVWDTILLLYACSQNSYMTAMHYAWSTIDEVAVDFSSSTWY